MPTVIEKIVEAPREIHKETEKTLEAVVTAHHHVDELDDWASIRAYCHLRPVDSAVQTDPVVCFTEEIRDKFEEQIATKDSYIAKMEKGMRDAVQVFKGWVAQDAERQTKAVAGVVANLDKMRMEHLSRALQEQKTEFEAKQEILRDQHAAEHAEQQSKFQSLRMQMTSMRNPNREDAVAEGCRQLLARIVKTIVANSEHQKAWRAFIYAEDAPGLRGYDPHGHGEGILGEYLRQAADPTAIWSYLQKRHGANARRK